VFFNQGRIKRRFDELAAFFCNFGKNELKMCSSKMITDGKEYYQFKVNSITKDKHLHSDDS